MRDCTGELIKIKKIPSLRNRAVIRMLQGLIFYFLENILKRKILVIKLSRYFIQPKLYLVGQQKLFGQQNTVESHCHTVTGSRTWPGEIKESKSRINLSDNTRQYCVLLSGSIDFPSEIFNLPESSPHVSLSKTDIKLSLMKVSRKTFLARRGERKDYH